MILLRDLALLYLMVFAFYSLCFFLAVVVVGPPALVAQQLWKRRRT